MVYNVDFVSLMSCLTGLFLGYLMNSGVHYRASYMDSSKMHKSLRLMFNDELVLLVTL